MKARGRGKVAGNGHVSGNLNHMGDWQPNHVPWQVKGWLAIIVGR